jgi:hypothetical protein
MSFKYPINIVNCVAQLIVMMLDYKVGGKPYEWEDFQIICCKEPQLF